jgi:hypothetical protein
MLRFERKLHAVELYFLAIAFRSLAHLGHTNYALDYSRY